MNTNETTHTAIWIGADYPFDGSPWEVFGATVYGRPNVKFIAMITADQIPWMADVIYQDEDCTIYRFWNIMFQIDTDGNITTDCEISGGK
jgi:hypothetical protein